ncbi:MAG: WD40/YVTN/BNR-like repeat-containing protein [Gemmatimonadales bacterium]
MIRRKRYTPLILLGIVASLIVLGPASGSAQSQAEDLIKDFNWRNIGPAAQMGRVSTIDAWDENYRVVLIGAASGGVFKSINGGISLKPIFEHYGSQSIGDVAFFQADTSIIWVGTGEATNRNSVGWGDGIYKSTDGGKTFINVGLRDTYQISEIATHPTDPNVVYAAALGNLWAYTGSRGLYKTTDGGATWNKLTNGLPDDGKTGATVVAIHPSDPNIVFAGMYQRLREPSNMHSGGPNGGIFKSTDAGHTWRHITQGLPEGATGQIDIDFYRSDPQIMWAYVEASDELPEDLSISGPGVYKSTDGGESWTYVLRHNSRPYYHGRIRVDPTDSNNVYVIARDFYHSRDGGQTWKRGSPWNGGGDDHDMWISPHDGGIFYNATDQGAYLSVDEGKTELAFNNMAIGQYYAIGVDMRDPYWIYGGMQDNGGWAVPSNSRDPRGILNDHATETNGGDGFHMQVDPTDWRTLYTTAHVGYFGRQNMETREHVFITPTPKTTVNFHDFYDPAFDELQTNYSINGEERWLWRDIPNRTINGNILPPQFRFNWNSPLVLSPNNPRTVYIGSNYLFKSVDRGDTWRIVSPDLTTNNKATRNTTNSGGLTKDATGAENHNTIYTIAESPINDAVVWVGTDDGNVQVTRDGGATWTNVRGNIPNIPREIWVSRVEASHFDVATAYVSLDGHRTGDVAPHVFKTTDFGRTWQDISSDLPRDVPGTVIHTVVEDHVNPDLLFIGTEFGVYVTMDNGRHWNRFGADLPSVAVRDIVIHPRDNDLIAGTHGRSAWIADNITPLQQITPEVLGTDVHMFENRVATNWLRHSKGRIQNYFKFRGGNPHPGAAIDFYLLSAPDDSVTITVRDRPGTLSRSFKAKVHAGINRAYWDLRFPPTPVELQGHRNLLEHIVDVLDAALTDTPMEQLAQMRKDLLASQRYPNLYEGEEYDNVDDAVGLLRQHLKAIKKKIEQAKSVPDFFAAREQLLAYSSVVGDRAFFGFFGEELRYHEATPGTYVVTIVADGHHASGTVRLRNDPLLER